MSAKPLATGMPEGHARASRAVARKREASGMPSEPGRKEEPRQTLQRLEVHRRWAAQYRTAENEPFLDAVFEVLAELFGPPGGEPVLDAGCGSGTKSVHLARRGYHVLGIDFSEAVLREAQANALSEGVADRVQFELGDLTSLPLRTGGVGRVLCWGVLMHIPSVGQAIAELSRVLAPGGVLVVSEGNVRSAQSLASRGLKAILRRRTAEAVRTPAGLEVWENTSSGRLLTRQADIPWHIREFQRNGLRRRDRRAGQATEIYAMLPWRFMRRAVHAFNDVWFKRVRWGGPAFGNLLVFRKPDPATARLAVAGSAGHSCAG